MRAASLCWALWGMWCLGGCAADTIEPVGALEAQEGDYSGMLEIDPEPSVGYHHVELELQDDDGEPLEGAEVVVSPFMPAHGHGSIDVEAKQDAPGLYVAERVWLNMPGRWDIRVYVTADGGEGRLVATLEVP